MFRFVKRKFCWSMTHISCSANSTDPTYVSGRNRMCSMGSSFLYVSSMVFLLLFDEEEELPTSLALYACTCMYVCVWGKEYTKKTQTQNTHTFCFAAGAEFIDASTSMRGARRIWVANLLLGVACFRKIFGECALASVPPVFSLCFVSNEISNERGKHSTKTKQSLVCIE